MDLSIKRSWCISRNQPHGILSVGPCMQVHGIELILKVIKNYLCTGPLKITDHSILVHLVVSLINFKNELVKSY